MDKHELQKHDLFRRWCFQRHALQNGHRQSKCAKEMCQRKGKIRDFASWHVFLRHFLHQVPELKLQREAERSLVVR